jgi:ParB family chromosome partitioning protein
MAAKRESKKALGRGLDALFGEVSVSAPSEDSGTGVGVGSDAPGVNDISYIHIDDIKPNAAQPRRYFNEETLDDLAVSIKKHGLIQPIMIKSGQRGYELIAGERRWRAARRAGLKKIPAIIKEVSAEENALFSLIENMQREDLNPVEEAQAYRSIMDEYHLTQEEISKSVGKSRPHVANTLRLLKLPERVCEYIVKGKLSAGHANAIGAISDSDAKIRLAEQILREGLSVREAEILAQKVNGKEKKEGKRAAKYEKSPEIRAVEEELTTTFGTKVTLGRNEKRGTVEFHYYSRDELEGLIEEFRSLRK